MVSTRQRTIGHGPPDSPEQSTSEPQPGTSRTTRNSSAVPGGSTQVIKPNPGAVQQLAKPMTFLDLPQEIVEKIFSFLPFKNICQLRFVSTRVDRICGHILNSTFQRLQHQLLDRFHKIKSKMPRRESARRNHHLACESDIVETLHMRLTLLQMSLGKHIERKHCYFFPGEILDEVFHILHYIKVTPKLGRPYKVTDELFDLSTMAMEYFKEHIEPDLPEIAYFSADFLEFSGRYSSKSNNNFIMDPYVDDSPINDMELDSADLYEEELTTTRTPSSSSSSAVATEGTPQSNIVLRKGIRKIKAGMKRYNNQLSVLKSDVRTCRQKTSEQQRLMAEQQKQLAEQQKQLLEYATRMDEHDKKNEEISRKFSTLLQELNKCKTELQYWRSKSPAVPPFCATCGAVINFQPEVEEFVDEDREVPEASAAASSSLQEQQKQTAENVDNDIFPELLALPGCSTSSDPPSQVVAADLEPVVPEMVEAPKGMKRKFLDDFSKPSCSKKSSLRIKGRKRSKV